MQQAPTRFEKHRGLILSRQDPYDDEPAYLDLGKWLRITVTAASALALLALLYLAATDQGPSLPQEQPLELTAVPATPAPNAPDSADDVTPTPSATPTHTPTAEATRAARGTPSATPESIREMVQTAVCSRLSCSDFYSRTELDLYLAQCPDDYGKFDRDGDGRTCYDADDW